MDADPDLVTIAEVARELGRVERIPQLQRRTVPTAGGEISSVVWGDGSPEVVFLHGAGQNARTWDAVGVLLDRPMVAIDLPGHGWSAWRSDHDYAPQVTAGDVAQAIEQLAPAAKAVVGMSLGGLTLIAIAAARPDLVRRAMIVDAAPGIPDATRAVPATGRGSVSLLEGPRTFASFDEMVAVTAASTPARPRSMVERGVRHNAVQQADGTWRWRYDDVSSLRAMDTAPLWDDLGRTTMPMMLVQGGRSPFVTDAQVAEFLIRRPDVDVRIVADAGHSVQSDQPLPLADLIGQLLSH